MKIINSVVASLLDVKKTVNCILFETEITNCIDIIHFPFLMFTADGD